MFFAVIATIYALGDSVGHVYTVSPLAMWILISLALLEVLAEFSQ